jgi:hypothetical protein
MNEEPDQQRLAGQLTGDTKLGHGKWATNERSTTATTPQYICHYLLNRDINAEETSGCTGANYTIIVHK